MASKLDLADAQFIGFKHGKWNPDDIIGLIKGMGLTEKEWVKHKSNYPDFLDDIDIETINEYYKKANK